MKTYRAIRAITVLAIAAGLLAICGPTAVAAQEATGGPECFKHDGHWYCACPDGEVVAVLSDGQVICTYSAPGLG